MPSKPKAPTRRVPSKPRLKPNPEPDVKVDLHGSENAVAVGPRSFAASIKVIFQGNWKPFAAVLAGVLVTLFIILYFVIPKQNCDFDKEFTVTVAEFVVIDESGKAIRSDNGLKLAESIASQIGALFKEMHLDTVMSNNVCGPMQVGKIQTEEEAREYALSNGVTIVIYGQVKEIDGSSFVSPRFFVNHAAFKEADEIAGQHELGDVRGKLDESIILAENPGLQARIDGLSRLTIGLVYYSVDNYDKALEYFQKADDPKWAGSGKETVHLLIGNVYIREASENKDFESLLPLADAAYQKALEINSNYGRAMIGEANVLYLRALTQDNCDPAGLEAASALIDKSLTLTDQPESANIETKAHFYRGQIAIIRDYCEIPGDDWRVVAEREFTWVIERYAANPESDTSKSIEFFASHAYARLGYLAYLRSDLDAAIAFTEKSIPIAPPKDKADYYSLLGDYLVVAGENDKAVEAYQQAITFAVGNGDTNKAEKFQNKLDSVPGP